MIDAGSRRRRAWSLALGLIMLYAMLAPLEAAAQDAAPRVKAVEIRGNKHIELDAIQGRMTLKAGDPYTADALRSQIRTLYDTGFFEDVRVETEPAADGIGVIFVVREKPFITDIVFDGNENLSDDKLKEKITIKNQSFLDQQQAKESADKIRLAYQEDGYYNCQVIPVVQTIEEDRKRLTFFIKEGEKARIKTVTYEGMRALTKDEVFKVTATREWIPWYGLITQLKLPSIVSDAGILKREEVVNDIERVRELYLNKGYMNVQISQPEIELSEDKKWFMVHYSVVEGEPFTVAEVGFRGNTVFEDSELREGLSIRAGEIFQRAKIRSEITRITDLYGARGYAFADVVPNVNSDNNKKTATIIFNIKEGEMMRIRQIHINGNDKTRDNVIRRELRVDEQDVIDTTALKRSFQRLNNLNFFETVEILPQQVESDKVDLNVKVKEKPTGQFSIGGGFSTLDRLVAIADITEGNLGGRGWLGRIRGQLGQRRTLGLITFRNPYVNDSYNSLQLDVYRTMTNYITYFESKSGASVAWSRWLSEYVNASVSFFGEQLNYRDPQPGICPDQIPLVCNQLGTQSSTGFRTSVFRDTRDYYLDPRTGWRFMVGVDYGTPALGGTNHFYKYYVDVIKYTPLLYDTRFSVRARYGVAEGLGESPIPLTERFFVGGINTMRGFVFGRAGPVTPSGSLLGAASQLIINNDFIFTISSEAKLNGVIFFDYGKGFDDNESVNFNLRPTAGIEGRWISPFGPLRAAYGINLDPNPNERKGVFEFTIGSLF
ncbi:MAG TPA: outer membrane protein assembly factor BamA [Nitrospiraceae bacterium]|nr:outer membrane protein assembly factor BamA [Nitrospiraceae bacterium]